MLSYASNFRQDKKASNPLENNNTGSEKKKEEQKDFAEEINNFKEVSNMEVNFNYNLNYNYASEIGAEDMRGSFYLNKLTTPPNETVSGKSSFRDKNKMTMSRVTFKDSDRPLETIDQQFRTTNSTFGKRSVNAL